MSQEALRRKQHLVSRAYQDNFAKDRRVAVLDAKSGVVLDRSRPTKSNWVQRDFVTVSTAAGEDDSLEREFADHERTFINQIRDIKPPRVTDTQKQSLDMLAAVHLVRNPIYVAIHKEISDGFFEREVFELSNEPDVLEQFRKVYGRDPISGELDRMIAAQAQKMRQDPRLTTESMRRSVESIPEILGKSQVQLISAPDWMPGFTLPDQPILHAREEDGTYGFLGGLAPGDADRIMVPLSRRLLACYTRRFRPRMPRHLQLKTKRGLMQINSELCRNAFAELICHPDDAPDAARLIRSLDRYPAGALRNEIIK